MHHIETAPPSWRIASPSEKQSDPDLTGIALYPAAEFAAHQRVHHLHVAFCPPLPAAPEFAMEQVEGPEAALTAGQVESYGARIDLRLAVAAPESESVVVEFYARGASTASFCGTLKKEV